MAPYDCWIKSNLFTQVLQAPTLRPLLKACSDMCVHVCVSIHIAGESNLLNFRHRVICALSFDLILKFSFFLLDKLSKFVL